MKVLCVILLYLICFECFWVYADDNEKLTDKRQNPDGRDTYSARVVGGMRVPIKDYPYNAFVFMELLDGMEACGGVIIGTRWILTAGHCKTNRTQTITVWVSLDHANEGCEYTVGQSIQHPLYKDDDIQYDYMLLNLNEDLTLTGTVQVIPIGSKSDFIDNEMSTLTGYGDTKKPSILPCFSCKRSEQNFDLHDVQLPMISRNRCLLMRPNFVDVLSENEFCAGYKDWRATSCKGDSGSPLVFNGLLMGIVSGKRIHKSGCPQPPTIVSSVPYVREWIHNVTNI